MRKLIVIVFLARTMTELRRTRSVLLALRNAYCELQEKTANIESYLTIEELDDAFKIVQHGHSLISSEDNTIEITSDAEIFVAYARGWSSFSHLPEETKTFIIDTVKNVFGVDAPSNNHTLYHIGIRNNTAAEVIDLIFILPHKGRILFNDSTNKVHHMHFLDILDLIVRIQRKLNLSVTRKTCP